MLHVIKKIIPVKYKQYLLLLREYMHDFKMYKKHSSLFKKDTFGKFESEITLRYHAIEKGFLHNPIKYRFAKERIEDLILMLKSINLHVYVSRAHIQSALLNLCKYYEFHVRENIDISDYYKKTDYDTFKKLLFLNHNPIKSHTVKSFFQYKNSDFRVFSVSRSSVRSFTGEKIPQNTLQEVVDLANHFPSVCNRQPVTVHVVENINTIKKILEIQGGLTGYSDHLSQLIVVTSDRNYFYSIGERHQLYIDGGIYLMNLLYSLHYYGIGACPAHWGMPFNANGKIKNLLSLKDSEQVVSLIAIGVPKTTFSTTLSLRKSSKENLYFHK